jgi:16S rRNA (guanine966-N2)-methyltransferase
MPKGIRPSATKTRAAIFNILAARIPDAKVIDLYSGSGALGIEALSRGAARVTFVERDWACVSVLRQNLATAGYDKEAHLVTAEAKSWLLRRSPDLEVADVVLADPPYGETELTALVQALAETVPIGALVVVEHSCKSEPGPVQQLAVVDRRRYGDSALTLFQRLGISLQ